MNILIYFPYNLKSVEQLSVMELLIQRGHKVVLLTTMVRGPLHGLAEGLGVITEAAEKSPPGKLSFYIYSFRKLMKVIRAHRVEVVLSHQQVPALMAGLLNRFWSFRHIYIRHNSDEDYLAFPRKAKWLNKVVNSLTPVKAAPSGRVERFWVEDENVRRFEICRLNYGYDFRFYEKPDFQKVQAIRHQFCADLLILSMARLVPAKRHKEMFQVIRKLVESGINCKLICLGNGPMAAELSALVQEMGLESVVYLEGRRENIFDYLEAADIFLHLSLTEASNSAVKEASLCKKPVIVCKGVGDFEEYIVDKQNSFLVDKEHPVDEAFSILREIAEHRIDPKAVGERFFETIQAAFSIEVVAPVYDRLLAGSKRKSPDV